KVRLDDAIVRRRVAVAASRGSGGCGKERLDLVHVWPLSLEIRCSAHPCLIRATCYPGNCWPAAVIGTAAGALHVGNAVARSSPPRLDVRCVACDPVPAFSAAFGPPWVTRFINITLSRWDAAWWAFSEKTRP